MTQPTGEEGQGSPLGMFLPLLAILVIFWLFMIRPQAKKQKELRKFRESLKKGDKVVTSGGIYGKVANINENIVVLQVDENTKLTVDKASVLKDPGDMQQAQR
ncbi:MAG: preprotein translocase subunit YajC [Prolixibacteraceae bacterium]|nr:preprotein translocase subunit YajC [Prolixibacteraceae bacterium]